MEKTSVQKKIFLALQHVLAMFGATVLVPRNTGLDPALALFAAGIGTLIFHFVTKRKVPVFLGSSFAFIGAIKLTLESAGIGQVKGGIIVAGALYLGLSALVYFFGSEKIKSFLPPVVTGPIIMVIGLRLSPVAINMAFYRDGAFDWWFLIVSASVLVTMILCSVFLKGFFKLIPILISVAVGYIVSCLLNIVDFTPIASASWFGFGQQTFADFITVPVFTISSIIAIAPIALVVFIEHIGDITTNGAVVGKDFFKDPGLHRTLLGDGLATMFAGLVGGPANTTYSENTGVLAVTKVFDPQILRLAACFAVVLSLIGKFGGFINSIPAPVMGGISIILFGMIASIGVRTMVDGKIDMSKSRNLIIVSLILVLGIALDKIVVTPSVEISGLAVAAILGIILNKIIPQNIE